MKSIANRNKSGLKPVYEKKIYENSEADYVIGVDEVGRGCLAGPVVASACFIPYEVFDGLNNIKDSKQLTEKQRKQVYVNMTENKKTLFSICEKSVEYIDQYDIFSASLEAMSCSIESLLNEICSTSNSQSLKVIILIDGNQVPYKYKDTQSEIVNNCKVELSCQSVVKGDSKIFSIAAASIIAKVNRDNVMCSYNEKFPEYDFITNKGYATKKHIDVIRHLGLTPMHRLTFKPINTLLILGRLNWPEDREIIEIDPLIRTKERKKKRQKEKNKENHENKASPLHKKKIKVKKQEHV